jgi:DNA-binding response OmpR family regulator
MTFPPNRVILVVDDEAKVRVHAAKILSEQGCYVLVAETALAAYRVLERDAPDVVLLDAHLPGLDVDEFHSRLKLAKIGARLLLTSRRNLGEGLNGFRLITKPFKAATLIAAIGTCRADMQ